MTHPSATHRQAAPLFDTAEHRRLADSGARRADWKNWGPYVAERAWGTVREDYSPDGDAWDYFPHDHARSRGLPLERGRPGRLLQPLPEPLPGRGPLERPRPDPQGAALRPGNDEGNHGEDVKEYYYYLDGVPSHAYMRMLYKYPQVEYPYDRLVEENRRADAGPSREFELVDAIGDAFRPGRYFDVFVEYAKAGPGGHPLPDHGRQPRARAGRAAHPAARLVRNTWSWGYDADAARAARPTARRRSAPTHRHLGERWWYARRSARTPELLFTENETNRERLFGVPERRAVRQGRLPRGGRRRPVATG